jgi:fumarate hydratase class II
MNEKADIRMEVDSLGEVEVPASAYWGAQTQRSLINFKIGTHRMQPEVIRAFGYVKKAAALTNAALGKMPKDKAQKIALACDEVIAEKLNDHFPLVVWQTGSGTQSNMNANEVISNRAIEAIGGEMGSKSPIHPNDDVNKSQSSNDVFPTVMHVASVLSIHERLLPALEKMQKSLQGIVERNKEVLKIGRTHMMDATPISVGQEFSAYVAQMEHVQKHVKSSLESLGQLALGGTAVGTGLNTHPKWADKVAKQIAELTGHAFVTAPNKFMALSAHDAIVEASSSLRLLATVLMKLGNDIRLLASGPRAGLGELDIPANEPGSSIMPGKVNPTQCEALTMVAAQIMGNDTAVGIAGSQGHLQLNVYKPMMVHNLLESTQLASDAMNSFVDKCLSGLEPNQIQMKQLMDRSLMLVTALNQHIGYDQAAKIAKHAFTENKTLKQAALDLNLVSAEDFDKFVDPAKMIEPS